MLLSEIELEKTCAERIARGSKSFAFASTLFARAERRGAFFLYAWCRAADDAIDQVPLSLPSAERRALSLARLEQLRRSTATCFHAVPFTTEGGEARDPAFLALRQAATTFSIPEVYAQDLLDGMETDVRLDHGEFRFQTLAELRLYCYRVAGAVGILMSYVMGVSHREALSQAAELGIAMQLTNISRDVLEDARNGRVYLPADWCLAEGLDPTPARLLEPRSLPQIHRVILRCLAEAEKSYERGNQGLVALPFRAALAVGVASAVYRQIGRKLQRLPAHRYSGARSITSRGEKLRSAGAGLWLVLKTLPARWRKPWARADLTQSPLWRFEASRID